MDTDRRKELLAAYKDRRPEMGVISFRCSVTDEAFLAAAADIPTRTNRIRFQLSTGNCPNRRLQELWARYGEDAFTIQAVERLRYDDPKEDHTGELETLLELCLLKDPKAAKLWR
ncbi:GIY-YIG nuclease family protein [bacterium 1xD42-67]|nr:GIY-YIG nuclease family protein [bacterium 1xD42-67]